MLEAVFKSDIFENEVLQEESDSKLRFETFHFVFPPSHLTPPPRFNIISEPSCYTQMPRQPSPRWWWSPPGLLSQHVCYFHFLFNIHVLQKYERHRFLERRIASVCVFQAISLFVILPMRIVIQLVCSDPGSFSPPLLRKRLFCGENRFCETVVKYCK